jgi:thiol-disulfide isomerase/thioredoxin
MATESERKENDTMSHDSPSSGAGTVSGSSIRPGVARSLVHRLRGDSADLPVEGRLASFDGATGWLNTDPLTPEGLRGRVVLVDFWTYTCVNWIRTLPYLRAWNAKYREAGLTIVGVHTPEFVFERDLDNVIRASKNFGVDYPIALDTRYGIWQAFSNHFWPAIYIADAEGQIRFHHFGEGEYAMTEMVIQQLLFDAGAAGIDADLVVAEPTGLEVAAEWRDVRSPETYTGYRQSSGFAQDGVAAFDVPHRYSAPARLRLNTWGLSGNWTVAGHAVASNEPDARLAFRFHARDLNLVIGPSAPGTSIAFRVFLDGEPAVAAHGADVDADGSGTVIHQRTYQLIRQAGPIEDRLFEIEFREPGVEAYCFTFG